MLNFIKNRKLSRQELIEILEEFINNIRKYDIFEIPNELYINSLNKLEGKLNSINLSSDKRFVTYGRLELLRKELTERLNDESLRTPSPNWKDKWDNRMGAFWDLYDYIRGDRWFTLGNGPYKNGEEFKRVFLDNDNYYKEGYICKEEQVILLDMINEMKKFINEREDKMGLFNKNNKYEENPENNIPQFVYGIPDFMKDEIKKEENRKEVFNAFEGGYFGPSEYFYIDKVNNSYEFKSGYSKDGKLIPNDNKYSELKFSIGNENYYNSFKEELMKIIKDWESNYHNNNIMDGTQWNVTFVEENENHGGSNEFPENYNEMKKVLYKFFKVKEQEKYNIEPDDNIPREVYGIPDFMKQKENNLNKYDTNPEDNNPQIVYGIPDFMRKEIKKNNDDSKYDVNPEDNIPQKVYGVPFIKPRQKGQSVRIKLIRNNCEYVMTINTFDKKVANIAFTDLKNSNDKSISDISTQIPMNDYNKFIDKINLITSNWNDEYVGNSDIKWNVLIREDGDDRLINGMGDFPKNWNEFMDLVIEYELLFKRKKQQDIKTIKEMNDKNLSFEEIVNKQFKDPFWAEVVIRYFKDTLKQNETVSKLIFNDIRKYDDILSEFTKYLIQKTYDLDNPLKINGYTAKMIAELNPSFEACGVYSFMKTLRDDKDNALKIIEKGFPNKDVIPPVINVPIPGVNEQELQNKIANNKLADKYLKEIEEEVDQELIKLNLMTINEDGKKIPAFGSCHTRWAIEKKILKERYNIDWQTPAERNPFINYD